MIVVKPQEINDTTLTSSTIPEPDAGETVWSAYTSAIGDRRISTVTHRVYEAVVISTDDPVDGVDSDPPTWVEVGPTNKWAMFDTVNSTQSSEDTSLIVEIDTGEVTNSVAGFNIIGASTINITMTDPTAGVVYDNDLSMINNEDVGGWYDYWFSPIINITEFVVLDLPVYPLATIKVTVTGSSEILFGSLIVGSQILIGAANYGTSVQLIDFSRKETDEFGNTVVIPRRNSKLVDFDVTISRSKVSYVFNQLSQLTGIPSVWVGAGETNDPTLVFGYYRDYQNNISTPTITDATIIVEGLV